MCCTLFMSDDLIADNSYVRLVNGTSHCTGALELEYQNEWRPVSYQHSWRLKEAAVLCRQLACGSAVSTSKVNISPEALPAFHFYSDCDGSEPALLNCGTVRTRLSSSAVTVVCSGKDRSSIIFTFS